MASINFEGLTKIYKVCKELDIGQVLFYFSTSVSI